MFTRGLWREPVYSGICYYDTGVRELSQLYGTVRVPCCVHFVVPFVLVCVPFSCLPGRTVSPSSPSSVRLVPPFRLSRFSFPHLLVYIFRRKTTSRPQSALYIPFRPLRDELEVPVFPHTPGIKRATHSKSLVSWTCFTISDELTLSTTGFVLFFFVRT